MKVNIEGLTGIQKTLDKMSSEQSIKSAMTRVCNLVEAEAKRNCPTGEGTPQLRDSITHEIESDGNTVTGYVGTNVSYAPYVHQGTGIYAVNGDGRKGY